MKCRLCRIAHSNIKKVLNEAIDDLRNWELHQEKLKTWVEGNQSGSHNPATSKMEFFKTIAK